jgi:hypothetical protein
MKTLTFDQVSSVIEWMNNLEQLKDTDIPERFKEDWANKANSSNRPPLGLKPKYLHDLERQFEIIDAISRYLDADRIIPEEWAIEFTSYCK